jgi:3-hydroxyisobutyrate dehydrogenase-like beta-hydroxyacid dehydrogenase
MTERSRPVGVIGTGLMGTACARRLVAAGFDVLGFDVDARKRANFAGSGGRAAASAPEIARACDRFVLAVFDTAQVEDALEGPGGLMAARAADAPPALVVCVSTCDPGRVARLASRLPGSRVRYVEAPVSGTSEQVARGDALGLIGGERDAVEAARDLIEAIAPRWHYLGAAGHGGRAKLAITPRDWCSPSGWDSSREPFSRWHAIPQPTPRSWTSRETRW